MSVLDERVLVLNRNWQVVAMWDVRTAIENASRERASVLDTENYLLLSWDEWALHEPKDARWIKTTTGRVPAPDVVILKHYSERPERHVGFKRVNLARRDDFKCQYCGSDLDLPEVTVDHVLPRSRGGQNTWENCVSACSDCNGTKADKTPDEAGMKLRKQPTKPTFKAPVVTVPRVVREAWVPFLAKEGIHVA